MVGDLVKQVFFGSREQLLVHLFEERPLTTEERATLQSIVEQAPRKGKEKA
jgi:predicted transcriptional regulator